MSPTYPNKNNNPFLLVVCIAIRCYLISRITGLALSNLANGLIFMIKDKKLSF